MSEMPISVCVSDLAAVAAASSYVASTHTLSCCDITHIGIGAADITATF